MDPFEPGQLTTTMIADDPVSDPDGSRSQVIQILSLRFQRLTALGLYIFSITITGSVFGIFSNIVNIVIFYKMGFSTVSNISLFLFGDSRPLQLVSHLPDWVWKPACVYQCSHDHLNARCCSDAGWCAI